MFYRGYRPLIAAAATVVGVMALVWALHPAGAADPPDSKPAEKPAAASVPKFTDDEIAFFEKEVKPILAANCLKCHGNEEKIRGELKLTSRAAILRGGETGPAVNLKNPAESLLVKAIKYDELKMPPKGQLPAEQVAVLTRWVEMKLPWTPGGVVDVGPAPTKKPIVNDEARRFWSFQPIKRPPVPAVKKQDWVRTPIDAFILAKLETAGLAPAAPATREALARRMYYDLTGLPPTSAEVEAFVANTSPRAVEDLIDQLLESPHYGEKWGRHWLDLVHYAESNSFERDNPKPEVWRYRDYVIRAFNQDKPLDTFAREQLAGDELPQPSADSLIATGYYRLGLWDDESADPPQSRYDEMDDWVMVTSQVFLGLTMNCCRCHDHKIDPLPQTDYYKMQSFFRDILSFQNQPDGMGKGFDDNHVLVRIADALPGRSPEAAKSELEECESKLVGLAGEIKKIEEALAPKLPGGVVDDFKFETNRLAIVRSQAGKLITSSDAARYARLVAERKTWDARKNSLDQRVLCVRARTDPPETFTKIRGRPAVDGEKVTPGFPEVLGFPMPEIPAPAAGAKSAGRRIVLANWITAKENPLTARVLANRLWQYHFGRGIVRTSNDFGFQGDAPTHPELLDWLASELVDGGWTLKRLHKMIMMSSAYQMASTLNDQAYAKDPLNNLFWRFDLRRLTSEELRDSMLSVGGNLNLDLFGPSVYPPIPREVLQGQSQPGQNWNTSGEPAANRRSIYVHIKRSLHLPILETFDGADTDSTCPVRFVTTQPLQALEVLNGEFANAQAAKLAARIAREAPDKPAEQVAVALRLVTQRTPQQSEIDRGLALIAGLEKEDGLTHEKAMKYFCLLALNLNEFAYLD